MRQVKTWQHINWLQCQKCVEDIQHEIVVAYRKGEKGKVTMLQRNLVESFAGRCTAVQIVRSNKGKNTAGVDKVLWNTSKAKMTAVHELKFSINQYKASPIRRVWIPKDGKEILKGKSNARPLGIPIMKDRAYQALWNLAVRPIMEEGGDRHSYGFRKFRSTHDAMAIIHRRLRNRTRPNWILEADIKGFFDNISYEWLMDNIPINQKVLESMLKAGHFEGQIFFEDSGTGVPQGGPLSPTIANIALDGLRDHIKKAVEPFHTFNKETEKKHSTKVTMIRYADDFIVTAAKKEILVKVVQPAIDSFLETRGLELSKEKTLLRHIENGFDFLGFNTRLYKDESRIDGKILLIKPREKSVKKLYSKVKSMVKKHKNVDGYVIIYKLNPVLRGWANYFRESVAKKTFTRVSYFIWQTLWQWTRKKHPNINKKALAAKYYKTVKGRKWVFHAKKDNNELRLFDIAMVPIRRRMVGRNLNPYDKENKEYFEAHSIRRAKAINVWRVKTRKLLARQNYVCPVCNTTIDFGQNIETHHKKSKKEGGSNKNQNLLVLHKECHAQVTYRKSPKMKAIFMEKDIIRP